MAAADENPGRTRRRRAISEDYDSPATTASPHLPRLPGENLDTHRRKNLMILALARKVGHVGQSCQEVGIARSTHLHWLRTDVRYAEAVDQVVANITDSIEVLLIKWTMEEHNHQSARWLMERRRPEVYGGGPRMVDHHQQTLAGDNRSDVEASRALLPEQGLISALRDLITNDPGLRNVIEAEILEVEEVA